MRDLRTRHLTMDVSVSLAIGSAYIAGIWTSITGVGELYFDAVGMFALFLLAGRYLERRARERTAAATAQLVNLLPASCLRLSADGQSERILLSELRVGDQVLVHPGAILPADGKILDGQSSIDESLLTRRIPAAATHPGRCRHRRHPERGRRVDRRSPGPRSGHPPLGHRPPAGPRPGRKTAAGGNRRPRRAMVPVADADRLPPVIGLLWWELDSSRAFWIVLAMLVATCPCALSLATPTALTAATGTLHKLGLLLTRGHVLEGLNQIDTVIFDKTGTLTEGRLALRSIRPSARLPAINA